MKRNLHSPLDIEIILQTHYTPCYNPCNKSESHSFCIKKLLNEGLIRDNASCYSGAVYYELTGKGKQFLDMILNTPLPVRGDCWVDPRE